ncbi:hypothetical protein C8R46DRAFT_222608 [Mycena filopes]|nr:hypothetical protein C8R46DRAFT_222608 [Mycena filopes]
MSIRLTISSEQILTSISPEFHHMITPSSSVLHPQALRAPEPPAIPQPQLHDTQPTNIYPEIASQSAPTAPTSRPPHLEDVCRQHDLHQLSPSRAIRSPIPTPSPSPRRTRELPPKFPLKRSARPPKRQASDAYDYFRSDPDDEWSTLPSRKKGKALEQGKAKISGIKTTAAFRLPGTGGRVTGMSATSQRRVVTFLPPPLKGGQVEVVVKSVAPRMEPELLHVDRNNALPRAPKHSRESSPSTGTPKRRRLSNNPYPSPATSRLTPGEVAISAPPSNLAPFNVSSSSPVRPPQHRFLSPPTSDPVPEHDSEVQTTVAVGAVLERYPRTKSLMRQ